MTKFDELKERFPNLIPVQELRSNVSIVELAVQWGYEPHVYKGKSRPVLEHPGYKDTIIIKNPQDPSQQVYQRAGDFTDSGTVIDFIRNRLTTVFSSYNRPGENEFKNITSVLYDYLRVNPAHMIHNRKVSSKLAEPVVKQLFTKEQFDIRPLERINYLNQRHIAPQTIDRPEFMGKVISQITYFDTQLGRTEEFTIVKQHPERNYLQFTNVAFPYFNGLSAEVTGLELRSENVKLHVVGSNRNNSVFVSNPPPKTDHFYVMESAIDALSHRQLRSIQGDNVFNSVYFSTGGQLTLQQVNTIAHYIGSFDKTDNWQLHLSFDTDSIGYQYDLQFIQQLTAVKFPMSTAVAPIGRVAYMLPESEVYQATREAILNRVELFNKDVQAQITRQSDDKLRQKELNSQLIMISRSGLQVKISLPESPLALATISQLLLKVTGMDQRIKLSKSHAKDFNLELSREIQLGEKFRYVIKDETGGILLNGTSSLLMAKSLQQLKNQALSEKTNRTLLLQEREPFGFVKTLAEIGIEQGVITKAVQTSEYSQRVQLEKEQRNQKPAQLGHHQTELMVNAANKAQQEPEAELKNKAPRQLKR